jgi:hypothetical protein
MASRRESGSGSVTAGYLILSGLTVILFALALKEPMFIVFGIPITLIFALAASEDKRGGGLDEDLEAVGWTDKAMEQAVPFGIIGGMATLVFGGLIINYTPETASILIPDFTSIAVLTTASVIPPTVAVSANIISQWLVVAPSEESLARVLAPFAGMRIFKNVIIAYIFAAFFWILMHVPTFITQNAKPAMYLVLIILAGITTVLYVYTKNLMSSITAHGTFNTGVVLSSSGFTQATIYVVFIIIAVLLYAWISGVLKSSRRARRT